MLMMMMMMIERQLSVDIQNITLEAAEYND